MSRLSARVSLLVAAVLFGSCTPTVSGPALPRPTPLAAAGPTTTTTLTTTAASSGEDSELACPTELCLVYHIDRNAAWSDGQPVSASDFAYTAAVLSGIPGEDTDGYRQIEQVDALDAKTARVVFGDPYGPWQTLFRRVFRNGEATDDVDDVDTTGPFALVEWQEGESITLQRKPGWWADVDPISGDPLGDVTEIRFVFLNTLEEMVDALEADEVDVISARPDTDTVTRLGELPDIEMTIAPGPFWEHIDFHHDDPILSQLWAREAISLAIDREEILDATVRLVDPGTEALGNTVWMTGSPHYESHYEGVHDPEGARELLEENGCALGEDGVFVCQGRRMSFVWATTNDDPAREVIFETVREDLSEVGIELVPAFRSPSEFVTRDFLFGGPDVWQLVNFSWRARSDPFSANPTYYCDDAGALNVNRYCSAAVEGAIRSTESILDPVERAAVYNTADRRYLEDLAVIPLYQKPTLMAWDDQLTGPDPNFNFSADLWDVASWSGMEEIVIGLSAEPETMNPLSYADDSANTILGALLYGAFGMDASQEYQPVLVDSVELIEGSG